MQLPALHLTGLLLIQDETKISRRQETAAVHVDAQCTSVKIIPHVDGTISGRGISAKFIISRLQS